MPGQSPQLERIKAPVSADIAAVDKVIEEYLRSNLDFIHELAGHIIHSGGKRLRPLITLLSARAWGYSGSAHHLLAATVEFIHTATLLHDDVVDNAHLRRGHRTAKSIWGNNASILVGDFLYSRAFQMIVKSGLPEVAGVFADATNVIAEGEVRQLLNCRQTRVDADSYLQTIRCKTAKLFEAAVHVGIIAAAVPEKAQNQAIRFGLNIGMAFQLIDDALDYETHQDTGKPPAKDLAEGKPTMPLIYTLRHCSPPEAKLLKDVLRQKPDRRDDSTLLEAIELVRASNALEHTRKQARLYADKAYATLSALENSPYKTALEQLTCFVVDRSY